jgi:hypothetical protein
MRNRIRITKPVKPREFPPLDLRTPTGRPLPY